MNVKLSKNIDKEKSYDEIKSAPFLSCHPVIMY